jgi:3-oxoacyl-[acyl-carrier protein] reductase
MNALPTLDRPRVALVTGGARGIGLQIAQALAAAGMRVAIADIGEDTAQSAALLQATNPSLALRGDVSSETDCRRLVAAVFEWGGALDVLVNNAGISIKRGKERWPTEETSLEVWQSTLAVNLTGTFLMSREAIPPMKRGQWGRIINISSQAGRSNSRFSGSAYAASKAGVIGFSRILAGELGSSGITVNCVAPGRIRSPMNAVSGDEANRSYLSQIPVGRIGEGSDVGTAVAFLASEAASFVTGSVLDVNGGSWMV